jgi:hypothetical protein
VGNRPDAKPENCGSAAVPIDDFVAVLAEGIAEHNAREGRTGGVCAGRSFDAVFAASYASDRMRKPSPEQLRSCLLAQQVLKPHADHGRIRFQGNMYYAPWLVDWAGREVVARFDPDRLRDGLHIYAADGRFLGEAPCQEAVGFFDMDAAKDAARTKRRIKRVEKALLDELRPLGARDVAEGLAKLEPRAVDPLEAKVIEGRFERAPLPHPKRKAEPPATPEETAARAAFVADFGRAKEDRAARAERDEHAAARERFLEVLMLAERAEAGGVLGEAEATRLVRYRQTAEWRTQLRLHRSTGEGSLAK